MADREIISVIDVGSSALRLLIAQELPRSRGGEADWDILDHAEQPLALGRDVFRKGAIERRTMNRAVEILQGFQELMAPYGVGRTVAIGTSALRESRNRELFIDRVMLRTGIEIRVIDGVEANQLTWLAVREPLEQALPGMGRHNMAIIEVGAGNTELIFLHQGKVSSAHALPIGTLRFLQQLDRTSGTNLKRIRSFFRLRARRVVNAMGHELGLARVSRLVALGADARLVAARLGRRVTDEMSVIPRAAFRDFMGELESLSAEEVVARLDLPLSDAELLYPALVIFDTFVEATRAEEILVPAASIREGLLINYAASPEALRALFSKQILAACRNLAKHYRSDLRHLEFVRRLSLVLYDALFAELGLPAHHRLFLETAAILHDIGAFIGGTGHHKHGLYIVRNSDIFGLSKDDKEIVANVVRYHRRSKPQLSHIPYAALGRSSRIVVQKLAALLRVADALDRAHTQKIVVTGVTVGNDRLIIKTDFRGDLSLEELSLAEKGDLMEDVFGLRPVIRRSEEEEA